MFDERAIDKRGFHNPCGEAEFEVFSADQYPDLKLEAGWYWDTPGDRVERDEDGSYAYAVGPFNTSAEAYNDAIRDDSEG
jgi:hypothetical protein